MTLALYFAEFLGGVRLILAMSVRSMAVSAAVSVLAESVGPPAAAAAIGMILRLAAHRAPSGGLLDPALALEVETDLAPGGGQLGARPRRANTIQFNAQYDAQYTRKENTRRA